MTALLLVSLILPVLLAVRALWFFWQAAAPPALAASAAAEPMATSQLKSITPSADLVVDAPPPIDAAPLLKDLRPVAPPSIDFTLVGVQEDRDAADEAVWRAVQRALAARRVERT